MVDKEDNSRKIAIGEAVGVVAAESIGEPATQMVLRAFHSAGISLAVVTRGLPRIIEIIDARKIPKSPFMEIKMSKEIEKDYEKVRKIKFMIEEVRLDDLIETFSENLKGGTMSIILEKEQLAIRELNPRSIISKLSKLDGIEVGGSANEITIRLKGKKDTKHTRTTFVNIRKTTILGVNKIKKAEVRLDEKKGTYTIVTSGSNIKEVIEIEGIDKDHVYSNNPFEILEVYGIEAARNFIANELFQTIMDGGASTDFRHVSLVADAMTFEGDIKGVGRHGIAGRKDSVFARAAFEETVKHLVNAAIAGETDPLSGVAENILIGKQVNVGTGTVKLMVKKEDLKKIVK